MDVMRSRVALRERPWLDVLDLAIHFCAAHFRAYATLSVVVLVPAFAVSWAAARGGGWWVAWAVTLLLSGFASAPFVVLASELVFAHDVKARDLARATLRALPALLGVRSIQVAAVVGSMALLGIPWPWTGTLLLFVGEVTLLERAGAIAAVVRAQRIARGRFAPTMGAMVFLTILPAAAAIVADVAGRELLGGMLEVEPPLSAFRAGGSWLALIGWWLALPFVATARFFAYVDMRTRTEGWDIQTRFAAIAARAKGQPELGDVDAGCLPRRLGVDPAERVAERPVGDAS